MNREVWVTGIGAVCAQGASLPEIWDRLAAGDTLAPAMPTRLATGLGDSVAPGKIEGVLNHPAFCVPDAIFAEGFRHSAHDTFVLARHAAREAIHQAGLSETEARECGVALGSTAGNALHFLNDYQSLKTGQPGDGKGFADFFAFSPGPSLARDLGLAGPALTVGTACCSGTDALGLGWEWIRTGLCRRVVAGGADALSFIPYVGFRRLMIYSPLPCRPFDRDRRGLNLGEGAGMLVLEDRETAERRGAKPLAAILGYGAAADAHHLTAPHPEGRGLVQAITAAISVAGVADQDIGFVNAHGTATPDNDRVEGMVLKKLLPDARLWASKGATGHTLGAAGGLEAALAVMALHRQILPASPGFKNEDPSLGVVPTRERTDLAAKAALSTSLGFGGGAAALALGDARWSR